MSTSPSASSTKRNQAADLLKGVAVVLMVQVHLVEQFATLEVYQSTVGRLSLFLGGPPAAPVFLSVMGFFLARSEKSSQMRRGILLILGGLLLNIGLNLNLLVSIQQGRFQLDPLAFAFGADILPLAGLSLIIIALLRRLAWNTAAVCALLAVIVAVATPFVPQFGSDSNRILLYISPFLWGDYWWSYFPLFPWLAYPLLGFAFGASNRIREAHGALNKQTKVVISLIVFSILAITSPYAVRLITELPHYYHHGVLLMLWIAGFLYVWVALAVSLESSFGQSAAFRYLKWLGREVTSAYVFQWLIIGNLATELYRTQTGFRVIVWFVTVMLATSILVFVYRKAKNKFSTS